MALYSDAELRRIMAMNEGNNDNDKKYSETISDNINGIEMGAKKAVKNAKDTVNDNIKKSKRKLHITNEGYSIIDTDSGKEKHRSLLEDTITKDGYAYKRLTASQIKDASFMKSNKDLIIDVDGDKYIMISGPNATVRSIAGGATGALLGGIGGTVLGVGIAGPVGGPIGGILGATAGARAGATTGAIDGVKLDRKSYKTEEFHSVNAEGYIVLTEGDKPVLLKNGMLKVGSVVLRPVKKSEETSMKFGQGVIFHGKKFVYQTAEDLRDDIRHPAGTVLKTAGSAVGGIAGGAAAGAVGSAVGSAVGGATGKIVGSAVDTTRTAMKARKGYDKELDKSYAKLQKKIDKHSAKHENFDFHNVYRSKEYNKAITEHFDLNDKETRTILLSINEDDQTKVLVSLTSKLYDNIVDKIDDIDFGDIPATKGDITKLPNYLRLMDSVDTMKNLLIEYKQDTAPVDTIRLAISNIIDSTQIWKKGYALNVELPMAFYNSIVLSIIESTSYLISMCVQYIKVPGSDTFQATLDKSALVKTKDHMVFENLDKFNEAYRKGQITQAMDYVIKSNTKNFMGELGVAGTALGIVAILFFIIPILREVIFLFYYERVRISDYFDMQADMLQINAYNVEHSRSDLTNEQKKSISTKQMKVAERFRKVSNFISIKMKESEVKASKELTKENKKYQTKEVLDELPDSAASALF